MAQGAGKHQPAPTVANTKECAIPAPIERKSYRTNWGTGDALNARRRNSSANRAGQQSAAIDRWQKTAQWGLIAAIAARFVKIRHHGAPRRRNEAPRRKSWSKQSAPEFV